MWLTINRFFLLLSIIAIGLSVLLPHSSLAGDFNKIYQLKRSNLFKSIENVLETRSEQWEPVKAPNFGRRGGYGWVKIEVSPPINQKLLLEIQSHFIDSIAIWVLDGSKITYQTKVTYKNLSPTPVKHRYYLFQLPENHSSGTVIYIRGYNMPGDALKFPVKIWTTEDFLSYHYFSSWNWFVFIGIMLMIIIISIVNFAFFPDKIFLYYSGYILCMTSYALINDGWGVYIPQPFKWIDDHLLLIHWLNWGIVLFLLFSKEFLETKLDNRQKWKKLLNPLILGCFITVLLIVSNLCFYYYTHLFNILSSIGLVVILAYLGVWLYYICDAIKRKFKPVWVHIGSAAFFLAFLIFSFVFINSGFFRGNISDMFFFRIGLTLEACLLLIGWIYKNSLIAKEKKQLEINKQKNERIVQNEIERAEQMTKALQNQRERLARDLHDGIGTNLTHIAGQLDLLAIKGFEVVPLYKLSDFVRDTNRQLRETLWILNQNDVSTEKFWQRLMLHLNRVWEGRETPQLVTDVYYEQMIMLSPSVASSLFYIIQETITNALKHAYSQNVWLNLRVTHESILVCITDDGVGFMEPNANLSNDGYGLNNIQNRAKEIGAEVFISSDNKGTSIQLIVNQPPNYVEKYVN